MKKLSIMLVLLVMCFSLVACSPPQVKTPTPSQPDGSSIGVEQPSNETSNDVVAGDTTTYQTILDEYTEKLENATPALIDEYNAEAATNTEGLEGLATISNAKITKLAEISMEGVSEMAGIYLKTGSGKNSEYEEWAGKLQNIYMTEAEKIIQAYMDSAK